jgi:hypothetical protein
LPSTAAADRVAAGVALDMDFGDLAVADVAEKLE